MSAVFVPQPVTTSTWIPSPGNATQAIAKQLVAASVGWEPLTTAGNATRNWQTEKADTQSLDVQIFDSLSRASTWVSQLSMHLPAGWRSDVLQQLQHLLDKDSWDDDSNLLSAASVRTFLRFVIYGNVNCVPHLGINNRRELTATWVWPDRRAFMDFSEKDMCRAVLSSPGKFGIIRQAFAANVGDAVQALNHSGFDLNKT